ncbi:hypothetical protein GCM10023349_01930 [Nocardioides conyzicola]|uniref:Uncharacterized protein n=1 Tax=Nocardioides conyzicola TaxID=1651781 RepID=A0ABP8WMK5_9ACTN
MAIAEAPWRMPKAPLIRSITPAKTLTRSVMNPSAGSTRADRDVRTPPVVPVPGAVWLIGSPPLAFW